MSRNQNIEEQNIDEVIVDVDELIRQKEAEIGGFKNLLEQGDYKVRKIVLELGSFLHDKFRDANFPVFEGYLQQEREAQGYRDQINILEAEIEELKKQKEDEPQVDEPQEDELLEDNSQDPQDDEPQE